MHPFAERGEIGMSLSKQYEVKIKTGLDTDGVKKGGKELDSQLSAMDKRAFASALKQQAAFAQLPKSMQRVFEQLAAAQTQSAVRAAREVEKINAQTVRYSEQQSKIQERTAKTLADVQMREAGRAASGISKVFARTGQDTSKDFAKLRQEGTRHLDGLEQHARAVAGGIKKSFSQDFSKGFSSGIGINQGSGVGGMLGGGFGSLLSSGTSFLFGKVKEMASDGLSFADSMQIAKIGFTSILGDAEKASAFLKEMADFGQKSPFQTTELLQYSQQLLAVGVTSQKIKGYLTGIGDAAFSSGNFDKVQNAVVAITQMLGKGKISAEEMRQQLSEAIPGAMGFMARGLGVEIKELDKLMQQGRLIAGPAVELMIRQMEKERGGAMAAASGTILGAQASFDDAKRIAAANAIAGGDAFGMPTPESVYIQQINRLHGRERGITAAGSTFGPTVAGAGGKIMASEAYIEDQLMSPMAGQATVKNFFGSLFDGSAASKAQGAAANIVGSLTDTIKGGVGSATAAAGDLGAGIFSGLNAVWDFGSPSKKAIQLGQWIAEGLEIGLSKRQAGNYAKLKSLTVSDPAFVKKLAEESAKRGINPNDMLNVFANESSFNTRAQNKFGYTGLMQLGTKEAEAAGTTTAALRKMSGTQQLDYIFRYLDERLSKFYKSGAPIDQSVLYATVGHGSASLDPNSVFWNQGSKGYKNNPGWDVNKDGRIQQWEFGPAARNALGAGGAFSVNGMASVSSANPMPVQVVGGDMGAPTASDNIYFRNKMLERPHAREDYGGRDPFVVPDWAKATNSLSKTRDDSVAIFGVWDKTNKILRDTGQIVVDVNGGFADLVTNAEGFGGASQLFSKPLKELPKMPEEIRAFIQSEQDAQTAVLRKAAFSSGKDSAKELEKQFRDVSKGIASVIGDAGIALLTKGPRAAFATIRRDFGQMLVSMFKDYAQSRIYKLLTGAGGQSGEAAGGGQGLLGALFGKLGGLFGGKKGSGTSGGSLVDALGAPPPAASGTIARLLSTSTGRVGGSFGFGLPSGSTLTQLIGSPEIASAAGITAPASLSLPGGFPVPASISSIGKQIGDLPFTAFGRSGSLFGSGQLFGGLGFGRTAGSGGALASLAPLLGLQLGASVGGGGLGSIIGGIGGGLLGVGLTAAPAIFGAGGALASPLIAGLFSNPITAVVGGALLVGALIWGKNKARRKDETTRTQILLDSKSQITELIRQVTANKLDGSSALAQAGVIRANYLSQVSQLKDKKTRKIAEATVREIDAMIKYDLQPAIDRQLKRQDKTRKLVPEFARGGVVEQLQLIKLKPGERFLPPREHERLLRYGGIIPGVDRGVDDTYMLAPQGARIQNKQQQFAQGGTVGDSSNGSGQSLGAPSSRTLVIEEINLYEDSEGRIRALVKSKDFGKAVVKTVRAAAKNWEL
jgi:tape measure domain-containing protein